MRRQESCLPNTGTQVTAPRQELVEPRDHLYNDRAQLPQSARVWRNAYVCRVPPDEPCGRICRLVTLVSGVSCALCAGGATLYQRPAPLSDDLCGGRIRWHHSFDRTLSSVCSPRCPWPTSPCR